MDSCFFCKFEESHVAHDGNNSGIVCKMSFLFHLGSKNCNQAVTVNKLTVFIHCKAAVSIAVKSNTQIISVFLYIFSQRFNVGRTTVIVNIDTIWLVV